MAARSHVNLFATFAINMQQFLQASSHFLPSHQSVYTNMFEIVSGYTPDIFVRDGWLLLDIVNIVPRSREHGYNQTSSYYQEDFLILESRI
ncbi:hypothetical protein F2Q70_00000102 [Brassica cretica]|uniref:Uncharacterized protein n=1 Tax=Brassica cretica TaxID=69181 RepID=A0A3N6RM20_BRACR|nr:hypothetical protein F2Q70_00000102 [Brassica cretica]KAF3563698.1 hypothetical protein DY000_02010856 [Brassica cretica]